MTTRAAREVLGMELVLASQSPRRQDLLRTIGVSFRVRPADVDEAWSPGEDPVAYVERIARLKADTVFESFGGGPGLCVLAADTTVDLDGVILAKPDDDVDARRMLRAMSARTHHVHTHVVGRTVEGACAITVTTDVTFVALDDVAIDWYLGFGEHADKAGAYGMQGAAAALVERIDGSPSNVVGLPLAETIEVLRACGVPVR